MRKIRTVLTFAAVVAAATVSGAWLRVNAGTALGAIRTSHDYVPQPQELGGPQLLLLFVVHSGCMWCQKPELPPVVERAKLSLASYAAEHDTDFRAIGIALDRDAYVGLRFLERFGLFDELAAGGSWENQLAMQYIFDGFVGEPATPQIIVVSKDIGSRRDFLPTLREHVLRRLVGLPEIDRWVESGTPLPALDSPSQASNPSFLGDDHAAREETEN